jgi:glyoxylase-like metal-dependent hydrolase (beta-lactamase superfamily II)
MRAGIYPINYGFARGYVIRAEGSIIIDSGSPNQVKRFAKALERLSMRPQDIRLMVITHGHWDHIFPLCPDSSEGINTGSQQRSRLRR